MSMPPDGEDDAMPSEARFVKRLVVVLTSVMIVGIAVIVGLLVLRLTQAPPALTLPDSLALPDGITPEAVTLAQDWVLVVAGDAVLLFDRASGALSHRITLP